MIYLRLMHLWVTRTGGTAVSEIERFSYEF
jgi:hypothetical protein